MASVLVTDCWTNKSLSVVRSLARAGHQVSAASHKRISAAMASSAVRRRFVMPSPDQAPALYANRILELVREQRFDVLLALEESSMQLLEGQRAALAEINPRTLIPLPPRDAMERASDKIATLQLAGELGVPIPKTARQPAEAAKFQTPLIVKPARSSGSQGWRGSSGAKS